MMADVKRNEYAKHTRTSSFRETSGGNSSAVRENIKKQGGKRRKSKRSSFGATLFFLLVAALFLYGFSKTLFFNVEGISVNFLEESDSSYTKQQIIEQSKIALKSNLFLTDYSQNEKIIEQALPYVGHAEIVKKYPDVIEIRITSTAAYGYIEFEDTYYIMDNSLKVLEATDDVSELALPEIRGIDPELCQVGEKITINNTKILKTKVDIITNIVDNYMVEDISYIDVGDTLAIKMKYLSRFEIWLGDGQQMKEKAEFLQNIISGQLGANEKGIIDVSDTEECHFIPNR